VPDFAAAVQRREPILTDGGIETQVMFETDYAMDPDVQVAAMVGDPRGDHILRGIYGSYIAAARTHSLPIVIGTPTFRASENFTRRAGLGDDAVERLNRDAAAMHRSIRNESGHDPVFVAGVIGPSGDAYAPADASDAEDAAAYHGPQARALAGGGVDLLFGATFPAVDEAVGACRAMAETGLPYVISWILDPDGDVLDGTSLAEAIRRVDSSVDPAPVIHSISCVHPSVAARAVTRLRGDAPAAATRLGELKANGSPLPTEELIKLDHLEGDPPEVFADEMAALLDPDGLHVLGGCCGTSEAHMRALAARLART
jgi:S-methylmethionine-dependent homocysteine/selenocysteine methylase